MERYFSNSFFLFCIAAILMMGWWSCKGTEETVTSSEELMYDQNQFVFIPQMCAYHFSTDSSEILFSIPSKDILFTRTNASSPFQASIESKIVIREGNIVVDTLTSSWTLSMPSNKKSRLSFSKKIALKSGFFTAEITIKDLNRNFGYKKTLRLNKSGDFNGQYFKLVDASSNQALTSSYVEENSTFMIESALIPADSAIYLRTLEAEVKLPPAPFSTSRPEIPEFTDCSLRSILSYAGKRKVTIDRGLFQLIKTPESKIGLTLFTAFGGYPDVRKIAALHQPLRYLTTKSEFESISTAKNPKEKVDLFWIECGGTKDRARELIRSYYTRVEEANQYFSSYTEGWRTDRGMIHLVFGDPSKIVKEVYGETWIYGEENSVSSLRFNFQKVENPWSDNVFVLNRDQMFRLHWERMVTAWRNGRIFSN